MKLLLFTFLVAIYRLSTGGILVFYGTLLSRAALNMVHLGVQLNASLFSIAAVPAGQIHEILVFWGVPIVY